MTRRDTEAAWLEGLDSRTERDRRDTHGCSMVEQVWLREMAAHVLVDGAVLFEESRRYGPSLVGKHWWLVRDDVPVAYLHTLTYASRLPGGAEEHYPFPFILCDIEVRAECRRQGLARRIVADAEQAEGYRLYTSGGFTPLGSAALSWLPVQRGETPGIQYQDMPFVADWDTLTPINRI